MMKTSLVPFTTVLALAISMIPGTGIRAATSDKQEAPALAPTSAAIAGDTTETLVLFRHGEKTASEYGQLSPKGLNRALALPDILIGKYGKPDFLFAPNPSVTIHNRTEDKSYSYIRPLATIEPTAIKLGMPVNAQFGFTEIQKLETELEQPAYAKAVIFISWEHLMEDRLAKAIVKNNGGKETDVPDWPGKDYDSLFVIKLHHSGSKTTVDFSVDHEGLDDKLSDTQPGPAGK